LNEVVSSLQHKNLEEIRKLLREASLEESRKRELSSALHVYFKDWLYGNRLLFFTIAFYSNISEFHLYNEHSVFPFKLFFLCMSLKLKLGLILYQAYDFGDQCFVEISLIPLIVEPPTMTTEFNSSFIQ